MTTGVQSKSVNLDSIFDPYVTGTSPGLTGIEDNGTDINARYAPLVYGTSAAATGISCKVGGAGSFVDLNTLFAAKGTAKYNTPDNGVAYSSIVNIPSGSSDSASITLKIGGGQYVVSVYSRGLSGAGTTTNHTFTIPSGVVQFQATLTNTSGATTNVTMTDTPSWTPIPGSLTSVASITSGPRGSASGTVDTGWTLALNFGNSGTAIYTGSNAWSLETDGSA